jgi:hypothetical protein
MKSCPLSVVICLAVLSGSPVFGAAAQPKTATVGVTVSEVTDIRAASGQPSECRLVLNLSGDAIADAYAVRQVRVTKALDELGRDLAKVGDGAIRSADAFGYASVGASEQQRLDAVAVEVARRRESREAALGSAAGMAVIAPIRPTVPTLRPIISVRNPSRQSATIKSLEGEIELFTPTAENGGLLILPAVLAHPAEFVSLAALSDAGVRIMYLTPETYEAKRAALGTDPNDLAGPWRDEFANYVKVQTRPPSAGRRTIELFYVDDPKSEIVDLELQSADGTSLAPRVNSGMGQLRVFYLARVSPADARLVVRIASAGALAVHPFKLENIPLP